MNKLKTLTLATAFLATVSIHAQKKMIVHLKDGQSVTYDMEKVDRVEVTSDSLAALETIDTVAVIGGTVASTTDMGSRAKWATHNVGASSMSEIGGLYTYEDALLIAEKWGTGWRLPTEKEYTDLYENCIWDWTVIDGIGGRLIKSTKGNTLFIPAGGMAIGNQKLAAGTVGLYWTDSTSSEDAKNSVGMYFDSANIYRMDFPKTNLFTVRLVKD